MEMKKGPWKDGLLVTVIGLSTMAAAFLLYYLLFALFEAFFDRGGTYGFVSWIRIGHGIAWILACFLIYRTRIAEWFKAGILAGALTAFMTGIGVQLYETPIVALLLDILAAETAAFLLCVMNKKWYHYYAVAMAVIAGLIYTGVLDL
ncbi:MAG: hypothetical protein WC509_01480 [Candidatus Izemoplasmatales bacterium]